MGRLRRQRGLSNVRILPDPVSGGAPRTGGVQSIQEAEVTLPAALVKSLWRPENLERLARAYWRYLSRISLNLLRVAYAPDSRTVVLVARPLALLRFSKPEYTTEPAVGQVTWRIDRGVLVQRSMRGHGHLRITVRRLAGEGNPDPESETIRVAVEVRNFYPWLRGSGWFSRVGVWVYAHTQGRLHVLVTRGFLRNLARWTPAP